MDEEKFAKYNLLYRYAYPMHAEQEKTPTLGSNINRYCIFCNKTEAETTFKKEAHIIPAGLGNKHFTSWNECDACNELIFSPYEDDLVNYLTISRILMRGRKRQGKPKYRPPNSKSYITSDPGTNRVMIELDSSEEQFVKIEDLDTGQAKMTFHDLPMYSYVRICKTLVHMGWSIMQKEWGVLNKKYDYIYKWLKGDIEVLPLYMDELFIPGGLSHIIFEVLDSKDPLDDHPLVFRLSYGLKVITFYLPASSKVNSKPKGIAHYYHVPPNIPLNVTQIRIDEDKRIKPENVTFTFDFSHYENFKNE